MNNDINQVFKDREAIRVRTYFHGERFAPLKLKKSDRIGFFPTVVGIGDEGYAVVFPYGAVVFFGADENACAEFFHNRLGYDPGDDSASPPEIEEVYIVIASDRSESVDSEGRIGLKHLTLEKMQVVAEVLAKSTALQFYEGLVAKTSESLEPMVNELISTGRIGKGEKPLVDGIAENLLIRHKMVSRIDVLSKPEVLWEHPELERLYNILAAEYELRERHLILERKLELGSDAGEVMLGLLHNRTFVRLEVLIIVLIMMEIVLYLYELILNLKH